MGTMLSGAFADFMAPGLMNVIALKYKEFPVTYTQYMNTVKSKKQYEKASGVEGMGIAPQKNEGSSVSYDSLTQGYDTTFTNITFGQGGRVTRECWDDDLYSVFEGKLGKFLARSVKIRQELLCADVLNNGFAAYTASGQSGGDGSYLFATNHPFASGGTYANKASTDATLSHTSLEAMITLLRKQKDAHSVPIMLVEKKLIIPSDLEWTARVILDSDQKSGTANNDVNVLKKRLQIVDVPYLSSTTAWFLQADEHSMEYIDRQAPTMEWSDDFDTGDAKVKVTLRASAGYEQAIGMYGSDGV